MSGGSGGSDAGAGSGTIDAGADSGKRQRKTCPLPTTFQWTSGAALAQPKSGWVSLKDFSHVFYNNKHIIYMTTHDQGSSWGSAMFMFDDWPDAAPPRKSRRRSVLRRPSSTSRRSRSG